jgi:pimeloyl-ACP methyl ester carboxylesterase
VRPHRSRDAVVIIPGIMGSALRERDTGQMCWGLDRLGWYARAWTRDMSALHVTDDERAGRTGRIEACGLLRTPALIPGLGGIEPYTYLARKISQSVVHGDAVLEFAYDWRLPVRHNADLLAIAADEHLTKWRRTCAEARLVLVAHSMGGLVARALTLIGGAIDELRAVVTLGTPYRGSPLAALLLATGRGSPIPLPRRQVRDLAAAMPGLHDLLPSYRCVDTGTDGLRLTPADVQALGGDADLAADAARLHALLDAEIERPDLGQIIERQRRFDAITHALTGIGQATAQSLQLDAGTARPLRHGFRVHPDGELIRDEHGLLERVDRTGDGTVPRVSAHRPGAESIAQQHGALARTREAADFVCGVITAGEIEYGGRLGDGDLGLDLPDLVTCGQEWSLAITGVDNAADVRCRIQDADTDTDLARPRLEERDEGLCARVELAKPGLYRVLASGSGSSPVTRLVLAVPPEG